METLVSVSNYLQRYIHYEDYFLQMRYEWNDYEYWIRKIAVKTGRKVF